MNTLKKQIEQSTPELSPRVEFEHATDAYKTLVRGVDGALKQHHEISYVPLSANEVVDGVEHFTYVPDKQLPELLLGTDMIICMSRDDGLNANYTDQYPERNVGLTPSGESNVDKAVELFEKARVEGNPDIKLIMTGRMHNRAIRMMLALPIIADFIGINVEDVYHMSQTDFHDRLYSAFTPERMGELDLDGTERDVQEHSDALKSLLTDPTYDLQLPTAESTQEDVTKSADVVYQEYLAYPRISTSRLMVERATAAGVPLDAIFEEDDAVDSISNLINTRVMMESVDELKQANIQQVMIVAGSDHLPRIMGLADHILDDGMSIVCVESEPALNPPDYEASCERELKSFYLGSNWIGDTRDIGQLDDKVETGYFSINRKDAAELAKRVASIATKATQK
jgi:hypothetical protein